MTDGVRQYVSAVRRLFPMLGKQERAYLKNLRRNIYDCFGAQPPDSTDAVIAQFGPPEDIVWGYLDAADPEYLLRCVRIARRWRIAAVVLSALALVTLVLVVWQVWQYYQECLEFLNNSFYYVVEEME